MARKKSNNKMFDNSRGASTPTALPSSNNSTPVSAQIMSQNSPPHGSSFSLNNGLNSTLASADISALLQEVANLSIVLGSAQSSLCSIVGKVAELSRNISLQDSRASSVHYSSSVNYPDSALTPCVQRHVPVVNPDLGLSSSKPAATNNFPKNVSDVFLSPAPADQKILPSRDRNKSKVPSTESQFRKSSGKKVNFLENSNHAPISTRNPTQLKPYAPTKQSEVNHVDVVYSALAAFLPIVMDNQISSTFIPIPRASFSCSSCGSHFNSLDTCKRHFINVHKCKVLVMCSKCQDFKSNNLKDFSIHFQSCQSQTKSVKKEKSSKVPSPSPFLVPVSKDISKEINNSRPIIVSTPKNQALSRVVPLPLDNESSDESVSSSGALSRSSLPLEIIAPRVKEVSSSNRRSNSCDLSNSKTHMEFSVPSQGPLITVSDPFFPSNIPLNARKAVTGSSASRSALIFSLASLSTIDSKDLDSALTSFSKELLVAGKRLGFGSRVAPVKSQGPNPVLSFHKRKARKRSREKRALKDSAFPVYDHSCKPELGQKMVKASNNPKSNSMANQLNSLAKSSPARAFELITQKSNNTKCTCSSEEIARHYNSLWNVPSSSTYVSSASSICFSDKFPDLMAPFSSTDVFNKVNAMSPTTSTGPDGLSVNSFLWLVSDTPGLSALTCLLNRFLAERAIPSFLKLSNTILIPKSKDSSPSTVDDFRPISITNVLYRIFSGLLADRLVLLSPNFLHKSQRGFLKVDGCLENTAEILELIFQTQRSMKCKAALLFVDFRKAFDLVDHSALLFSIEEKIGPSFASLISDMFSGGQTSFDNFVSKNTVSLKRGIRQGCPVSPLLFNLAIDELLRDLSDFPGFEFKTNSVSLPSSCVAYADDLTIFAENRASLTLMEKPLLTWCKKFRMDINHKKCAILELNNAFSPDPFILMGASIPILRFDEFYNYLGIRISKNKIVTNEALSSLIDSNLEDASLILSSQLAPHHKLYLIKTFIIPKFMHVIRLSDCKKQKLGNFDAKLRDLVRTALGLVSTSNSAFFHAPSHCGGLGIIELAIDADLVEAHRLLTILNSQSATLRSLIEYRIRLSRRSLSGVVDFLSPISDLLNSPCSNPTPRSTMGLNANISRLISMGLKFATLPSGKISLSFPSSYHNPLPLVPVSLKLLRKFVSFRNVQAWQEHKFQGNSQRSFGSNFFSNDFIRSGSLPPKLYKWVLAARMDLLPTKPSLKYRHLFPGDVTCRLCGSAPETLAHILNGCIMNKSSGQLERHNDVLSIISNCCPTYQSTSKRINLKYPFGNSKLRPDLLIMNNQGSYDILLDVVISFDNPTYISAAAKDKTQKYASLCSIHLKETGRPLHIAPFVIGSLGSVTKFALRSLDTLQIPVERQPGILKDIVSVVIRHSHSLYQGYRE